MIFIYAFVHRGNKQIQRAVLMLVSCQDWTRNKNLGESQKQLYPDPPSFVTNEKQRWLFDIYMLYLLNNLVRIPLGSYITSSLYWQKWNMETSCKRKVNDFLSHGEHWWQEFNLQKRKCVILLIPLNSKNNVLILTLKASWNKLSELKRVNRNAQLFELKKVDRNTHWRLYVDWPTTLQS